MLTGSFLVHQITLKSPWSSPWNQAISPEVSYWRAASPWKIPLRGRRSGCRTAVGENSSDWPSPRRLFGWPRWPRNFLGRFIWVVFCWGAVSVGSESVFFFPYFFRFGSWWFQTWLDYFSIYWDVILTINIFQMVETTNQIGKLGGK